MKKKKKKNRKEKRMLAFRVLLLLLPKGYSLFYFYGLVGWRGEGEGVEESRVELAKNKLILC